MIFAYYPISFGFRAITAIQFPKHAGNCLRGALGLALRTSASELDYENIFEPRLSSGPSGYKTPPKPFVFRCQDLNGARIAPGTNFFLHLNLFRTIDPALHYHALKNALSKMFEAGIGNLKGYAELLLESGLESLVQIDLNFSFSGNTKVSINFESPTDLKGYKPDQPLNFGNLLNHVERRLNALGSLYGIGAAQTRLKMCRETAIEHQRFRPVRVNRRSSRTGDIQDIGGFLGTISYLGVPSNYLPWLKAAGASGIGRHTVWGNGELSIIAE